ncbi:MAG: DUF6020 family protein [Eubacteriales bacterium]
MIKRIKYYILALATALAVNINFDVVETDVVGEMNSIFFVFYKFINVFAQEFSNQGFVLSIITVAAFVCYREAFLKNRIPIVKNSWWFALFLSIMYSVGRIYEYGNSLSVVFSSIFRVMKWGVLVVGFYGVFLLAVNGFAYLVQSDWDMKTRVKQSRYYEQHPFVFYFSIIMPIWLIHLLLRYPAVMSYDNRAAMAYYFGFQTFSDVQPVFHTWLFGKFISFGMAINSPNMGLFLFVLMQSVILALILSYSLCLMKKLQGPIWIRVTTLCVICIAPYYTGYISFPIKDMLYISFFVLLLNLLMEYIYLQENFWDDKKMLGLLVLSASGLCLFRNNGIYVYSVTGIILIFGALKIFWKNSKIKIVKTVIVLALPFFIVSAINNTIIQAYDVQEENSKEMFSLTYQQIARLARDYESDIAEEDKEIIRAVLDYDNLAINYNEMTADPVKSTFNYGASNEQLISYLQVWIKYFFKHPLCYVEATWNQNYYLFMPDIDSIITNRDCCVGEEIVEDIGLNDFVRFTIPECIEGLESVMYYWYALLISLPMIGLFSNVAFYIMLFLTILVFMINDKMKKEWLVALPLILSFVFIILAPQLQYQPRYAFPIIYGIPSFLNFYIVRRKERSC